MSATTTQLPSSGEFCRLRYETVPDKNAPANISFYTNNSKKSKFPSCSKKDGMIPHNGALLKLVASPTSNKSNFYDVFSWNFLTRSLCYKKPIS
jgi:hypothetical protein